MMSFDVGVVGGGVIGLSCAWKLAQRGAKVGLFERGRIAREASRAAAGMLAAQCEAAHHPPDISDSDISDSDISASSARQSMFDLCLQSRALYPDFAAELEQASGLDIQLSLSGAAHNDWRTPGILYVATRDSDCAPAQFARQKSAGHRVQSTLWHDKPAFWLPDEGQVDNRRLTRALHRAALRAGVQIFDNTPISLHQSTLMAGGERICGGKILLCGGAWSSLIAPQLHLDVRPIFGQMLSLRAGHLLERIVYSSDVYLVPRRDGRLIVGATMEERGFDQNRSSRGVQMLLQRALEVMPELADCELIEHWSGLRPQTPDGLPVLGQSQIENVWIASGHFRNGILLTPITADLLCDAMLNGSVIPADFSPSRFAAS